MRGVYMIQIYKKLENDKKIKELKKIEEGSWIHLTDPTPEEIETISKELTIDAQLLTSILDEEEQPRLDEEEDAQLVIIDVPRHYMKHGSSQVKTNPIGILLVRNQYVLTLSKQDFSFIKDFQEGKIKGFYTDHKSRFVIQLLYQVSTYYIHCLKEINKTMEEAEDVMFSSTSNHDLVKMLSLEKSLVYFSTSLRENEAVLEKLSKGNMIPLFEDDMDLLEDAIIENRQGIEMASLYREILSSMTDAFATVISNNLNNVMKFLTSITIVISIPTMIFSFFGMNVPFGSLGTNPLSAIYLTLISILIAVVITVILKKKNML